MPPKKAVSAESATEGCLPGIWYPSQDASYLRQRSTWAPHLRASAVRSYFHSRRFVSIRVRIAFVSIRGFYPVSLVTLNPPKEYPKMIASQEELQKLSDKAAAHVLG